MAHETEMNQNNGRSSPPQAVAGNVKALVHDFVSMAELQGQLFLADVSEVKQKSMLPTGLIVAGVVFALSGLPLLLIALAWGLHAAFEELPLWSTQLIAAIVGIVFGAVMSWIGVKMLTPRLKSFDRSREELQRNMRWLKATLRRRPSASTPRQVAEKRKREEQEAREAAYH